MRQQLIRYVELLFAGAPNADDIRQEILQNTLDRYDDLISQGRTPEAAYSLAISGIGDVSELIEPVEAPVTATAIPQRAEKPLWKKLLRAFGILLYIICPIPLFVLEEMGMDTIGLCGTLAIVAVATALMILSGGQKTAGTDSGQQAPPPASPRQELYKAVGSVIWTVGLVAYFIVSFLTQAWHITWLIFPITAATQGLATAIMDLKEAGKQ